MAIHTKSTKVRKAQRTPVHVCMMIMARFTLLSCRAMQVISFWGGGFGWGVGRGRVKIDLDFLDLSICFYLSPGESHTRKHTKNKDEQVNSTIVQRFNG